MSSCSRSVLALILAGLLGPATAPLTRAEPPQSSASLDLATLLDRHVQAMGGPEAFAAINTLWIDLQITESGQTIAGKYVTDRDGRMRIDIFIKGERVWTEALDRDTAWCQEAGDVKPKLEGPDAAAALKHGPLLPGKIFNLREIATRGVQLSLEDRSLLDGVNYYVIRMRFPDGFANYIFLNPDTYLVERQRDYRAMHPDADLTKKPLEARFSDYRKVDGVMRNFQEQTYNLGTGQIEQTTKATQIRSNRPIPSGHFSMPQ